ncbi:MAG: UvrD-helicase domain-containing protein [Deltaproteobacteria bacterium]|nr:UvrD-helicase domain-containing protein [Deltaproteobacteria bacterium]
MSGYDHVQIRASAGAGKTFQLTTRYLGLLARGQPVEHLLASTFSRKAAGEIIERVLLRLADAALEEAKAKELGQHIGLDGFQQAAARTLLTETTRRLHRMSIGTLDAFFMALVQSFGFELGFAPGWKILDEAMLDVVRKTAVRQALEAGSERELLDRLSAIYRGESRQSVFAKIDEVVKTLLPEYLESGHAAWQWQPHVDPPKRALEDVVRDLAALRVDAKMQGPLEGDLKCLAKKDWKTLLSKGVFKAFLANPGAPTYQRKPLPPELGALFAEARDHVRSDLAAQLTAETRAYAALLESVTERIRALKQRLRGYGFDDVARILAARLMAGLDDSTMAELFFRLDQRVQHMLLDELQDTSLAQWHVLQALAREITSYADGTRSFFCVGDVKQAIYGWRGGVSEIFDAITTELTGVRRQELSESRRSSPVIIDVVNRAFSALETNAALTDFPEATKKWLDGFSTHATAKKDLPGYARVVLSPAAADPAEQEVQTLQFVAEEVARLHKEHPARSIGVLVRRNKAVQRLIFELQKRDVVASEEGGNPLTDSPAVMLVLSLLRLADHPSDTVARFHVARSPLGEAIAYTDERDDRRAADLALQVREQIVEHGLSRTVRRYAQTLAARVDARNAGRLAQLGELAERYETQISDDVQSALRPASFVAFAQLMKMEELQPSRVRVMTIHQSKGLEFDVAVVADIEEPLRGRTPLVAFDRPSPVEPPARAFRYVGSEQRALFPELEAMSLQAKNLNVRERLSNLYVALTRPRYALHVFLQPPKEQKTMAGVLRHALAANVPLVPGQTLFEAGDARWFEKDRAPATPEPAPAPKRTPIRLQKPRRLVRRSPSSLEGGTRIDVGEHLRLDRRPSLARGSLVHKWLESIEWLDDGEPSDAAFLAAVPADSKGVDLTAELVALRQALHMAPIRAALSRARFEQDGAALRVYRELPFAVREGDVLVSGSFDRVIVARGDKTAVTIIDFKTDRIAEADLAARVRYYRPQMDAYRRAAVTVFRAHIEDVRCELVFLALGRIVALD